MKTAGLIFPHQLFKNHPVLAETPESVFLVEHSLFFGDDRYPCKFHKQKLAYHRATMSAYMSELDKTMHKASLIPFAQNQLNRLMSELKRNGYKEVVAVEVHDDVLNRRLQSAAKQSNLQLRVLESPAFINSAADNQAYRRSRKRWFMADFYQWQRRRLNILIENDEPVGGKWSFDDDNRRKLPKNKLSTIPGLPQIALCAHVTAAIDSVETQFSAHPGTLASWHYPITHTDAEDWLERFLSERFEMFGPYEDAIVANQNTLYHSVLTPMLNIGLLTPQQVVEKALAYQEKHSIPLNSVEGFIRQIIGWREFMRATYDDLGVQMRTSNYWQHTRSMPQAFYTATTGVEPVDNVIQRILSTGYCHHIERLMVLGGFMFLCEISPQDIYTWFMEMFVDSYDWVMVPNVYAMSQHADGGTITTKPYFSGSNYIIKMSHYKKAHWATVWDGLFWRWVYQQRERLRENPRWSMMVRNAERMDSEKMNDHIQIAEKYLATLHH